MVKLEDWVSKGPLSVFLTNAKSGFKNKTYRNRMINDILVGFSIGAMCIPQGMSYAALAGMPMHYGLYSNMIHPIGYFTYGTSNHVVTGSAAIENLMIGECIDNLTGADDSSEDRRANAAVLLSLICSLLYLIYRIGGLAIIADLLADPVLSGFATGAAFLVATSQLKHALGLRNLKAQWTVPRSLYYISSHLNEVLWAPLMLCAGSISFLMLCKQIRRRFIPGPLILVITSVVASFVFDLEKYGIPIVGHIPRGLPSFYGLPQMHLFASDTPADGGGGIAGGGVVMDEIPVFRQVFWESVKISSLLFVIHVSIAKTIAIRQEYQVTVPDELLAFSAMNLAGGCLGCYPGSTSISRSAAAEGLGATAGLQGPSSGLVVMGVLLFLTEWLRFLPLPCLAAIVLVGVSSSLAEFGELARLWKLQKTAHAASLRGGGGSSPDLMLWLVAFLVTFCFGASEGIIVSVALSLLWIGKSILRPPFIELGRIKETTIYRDLRRFPGMIEVDPSIAIFRIDAPLNFCNSGYLERHIRQVINERFTEPLQVVPTSNSTADGSEVKFGEYVEYVSPGAEVPTNPPLVSNAIRVGSEPVAHFIFILDCSSINGLDITSIGAIKRIVKHAANHGVIVAFSNWKGPQRDFLFRANFYEVVPPQRCFLSNHDAYLWASAVKSHPNVATEILRPMVYRMHEGLARTLTKTITRNISPPALSLCTYRTEKPQDEIEMEKVYEWDGLSALVPNVRVVEEQTSYGAARRWEVSALDED
ncbi:sulfate transporter [Gregarina niphandrodes]|uniref:Sulfate transporter n=1 Tax=Gregarina niphandrodes TaxID=110365 RepID=A0A023B7E8_GRENI|nr:sulfate transporter [Gregarina niphandrodes]EZG67216.1 sulfate transporter [Gregarina niphandrodes]|eukprot:XP_011130305.1 sulfate transporter [Gregarina niphandrodes]